MDRLSGFEAHLEKVICRLTAEGCPELLRRAIRHAVLGGGNRLRPRLLIAVSRACGEAERPVELQAATGVELIHCASLVHDDLPMFDDADLRRGRASVHKAFGEATAVLAGDALIIGAFRALAEIGEIRPDISGRLVTLLADAAGTPKGMTAGQGWEQEDEVDVDEYHRAKTASLFEMAAMAGAICGGGSPERFRSLGEWVGRTYQIADDIRDRLGDAKALGKPAGRDEPLGRPSVVADRGLDRSCGLLEDCIDRARGSVPDCKGAAELRLFVEDLLGRFKPAPRDEPSGRSVGAPRNKADESTRVSERRLV
jgi:geranylgeranyl diphosphate synthase type II